jgi:glycosyltransferase involved in cell wall biosynthesis
MEPSGTLEAATVRPIRVLEIAGNAIVGGMEACVERMVARLPRDRFSVSVLCPYDGWFGDRLRACGAEVLIRPIPEAPELRAAQEVSSIVRDRRIDVLHAHMPNAHALAGLAGQLAATPVLATIHSQRLTPLDLETHRRAGTSLATVCVDSFRAALRDGADPTRLHCIPNGVDVHEYYPARDEATRGYQEHGKRHQPPGLAAEPAILSSAGGLRRELGIPREAPLVGFVGRISPEKGPEVFVRAALLLEHPQAHFVLTGEGPLRERLEDLAQRSALRTRLHFAGLRNDMPQVYQELDVLVSSSHSEALPLAVLEAMATGLPVIATRVGGVQELVLEEQTGLLVEPGDAAGLARHIVRLLDSPELQRSMGAAARRRAVEHFDLNVQVDRTAHLLARLAATRATAATGAAAGAEASVAASAGARAGAGAQPLDPSVQPAPAVYPAAPGIAA